MNRTPKLRLFLGVLTLIAFSFSNAQNMFFHLLPDFVSPYTWVGLGADANWNTAANWSTNSIPGGANTAIFDNSCTTNCDPTINVAINVGGFNIKSTYAGTITQSMGNTVSVGSSGWTQAAGTFIGSNSNISISGNFVGTGGGFTSTSATLVFRLGVNMSAMTFVHNSGIVDLNLNCVSADFNLGAKTLNQLRIIGQCGTVNLQTSVITVLGTFLLADTNGGILNNGTIQAEGHVQLNHYASRGSATIKLVGGNPQTVENIAIPGLQDRPQLPQFEIEKTAGTTVTFNGRMTLTGNYIYTSGLINFGTSAWTFQQDCATRTIRPGNWNYPSVILNHSCGTLELGGQTLKVIGKLELASSFEGKFSNGIIEAYGDIEQIGTQGLWDASPVSATLKIIGNGNQTIIGSTGRFPKTEIASTGGIISVVGTINLMSDWTYTSGTIDFGTSTLSFIGNGNIIPGAVAYNHVSFAGSGTTVNLQSQTMLISGTTSFSDSSSSPGSVNNGSISASGNVLFSSYGKAGSVVLSMVGASHTTLSIAGTASSLATTHIVAKSSPTTSVSLTANTNYAAVGRNFTITSGTLNLAGFTFTVNSLLTISAGGRLLCNGGTATAGSWSILGEISCGTGQGITWTGAGGDNLWSTSTNWTNNTVPGSGDVAIFNNSVCVGANCNAQINSNLSVRGVTLQSTYTGTLTQNATRTFTVGTSGYTQAGGTFAGGDAAIAMNGVFTLSGGTFTATSGTWTQSANMDMSGAPTFNHGGGTWTTSTSITISPNGNTFNNVTFGGNARTQNLNSQTMIVEGLLSIADVNGSGGGNQLNNGTIEARGHVTSTTAGKSGTVIILINGTGAQTLTGSGNMLPEMRINKASGTLSVAGNVITAYHWTWIAGTVDMGTSTLTFTGNGNTTSITPGSFDYYNVTFGGDLTSHNLNGGTMIVTNQLSLHDINGGIGTISNGTIEARGNITTNSTGKRVSGLILINGTGSQLFTGGSSAYIGHVQINKPSGTLTLAGTIRALGNWTWIAGTIDAGTSLLQFDASGTITPGPVVYNNVNFAGNTSSFNLNAGTMLVNGTVGFYDINGTPGTISNGTIEARGDLVIGSQGKQISGLLLINGTGAQSFTGVTSGRVGNVEINKPSGTLTFNSTVRINGNFTYTAGTVDAGTSTIQFEATSTISPGPIIFNHVNFTSATSRVFNLNASTLVVGGNLVLSESSGAAGQINNGFIEARGNVTGSTNFGITGTALLSYTGSSTGILTWTAGSMLATTHTVAKSGGASVVLGANASFSTAGRDFTISSGVLDLSGYDFNVNDVLTIGVGATLKCNGGEITNPQPASIVNSGTINCPGYSTYDFNWTGAGGNSNWNTAGNWSGGVVPGATDLVVFEDTYCGGTCNATINVASSVRGVRLRSPFTGTIIQASGNSLTLGTRGWNQAAGVFTGGDSAITIAGSYILSGGSFTSTNGNLTVQGNTWNSSTGTYTNNSGTVIFDNNPTQQVTTINAGVNTFNNLNLIGWAGSYTITGAATVNGHLQFGSASGSPTSLSSGTISAKGHVTALNNGIGLAGGTATIEISGTGAQTITGSGGAWPGLRFNKVSGTATLVGQISLSGLLTYTTGTVDPGTSTLTLSTASAAMTHNPNNLTVNNLTLLHVGSSALSLNSQALNVLGTTTFSAVSGAGQIINSGTINMSGNLVQSGSLNASGSVQLNMIGNSDTTITPTGTLTFPGSAININKTSGAKVTLTGNTRFNNASQNLTILAGTLDMAGFNLTVGNNISNSGTLRRGTNPSCGTITQGGSFTGNAAICP